jgi:hypothetical protein
MRRAPAPKAVSSSTSAPVNGRLPPDDAVDCALAAVDPDDPDVPEPDDPDPPPADFVTGGRVPPDPPPLPVPVPPPPPLPVPVPPPPPPVWSVVGGEQPM